MFDNLQSGSVAGEKMTYGKYGDMVIDSYVAATNKSTNSSFVQSQMLKTIEAVGPINVSNHASDPKVYNVFDIAPSSVSNPLGLHNTLKNDPRVNQVWSRFNKPAEKAIHVEIPQK